MFFIVVNSLIQETLLIEEIHEKSFNFAIFQFALSLDILYWIMNKQF